MIFLGHLVGQEPRAPASVLSKMAGAQGSRPTFPAANYKNTSYSMQFPILPQFIELRTEAFDSITE